jgi:hypothetical protein
MEGKYTGVRYVHARSNIEAKIWHTKIKRAYYTQEIDRETDNTEKKYTLNINNFKINFYKTLSKFKNYDTITKENKVKLFSNFYLPIGVTETTVKEKERVSVTYTEEELIDITLQELEQEINKEIGNFAVLNKQVNLNRQDGYIDIELTYETLEKIGTEEKIVF